VEEWEEEQRLQGEKETLGLYLTGHPIDRYLAELGYICSSRIGDLSLDGAPTGGQHRRRGVPVVVSGLVVSASHRQTQRGRMGTLLLDDRSGRIECTLFNENYEQHRELISADKILVVSGMMSYDEFRGGLSIRADNLLTIEQARSHYARLLNIQMRIDRFEPGQLCEKLQQTLTPYLGGTTGLRFHYQNGQASGDIQLGKDWRVNPTDELLKRLEQLFGAGAVSVGYRQSTAQPTFTREPPASANRQRPASGG
jgi:DNA polymerase-3 subunit alpha